VSRRAAPRIFEQGNRRKKAQKAQKKRIGRNGIETRRIPVAQGAERCATDVISSNARASRRARSLFLRLLSFFAAIALPKLSRTWRAELRRGRVHLDFPWSPASWLPVPRSRPIAQIAPRRSVVPPHRAGRVRHAPWGSPWESGRSVIRSSRGQGRRTETLPCGAGRRSGRRSSAE
jgi:hypothetical protein